MKDKLIHKLKEYIRHCDRIIGNWEQSNITLTNLRREIAALEKQIEQDKLAEKIANTDYMDTEKPVYDENYLNDCIKRAKPNLSKIKDVDKHLDEIRGIEPKKVIDDEQYVDRSISIDQYIDANPELDDITTHKEIDESNE